jgi:putative ABC transport system permease protein
MSEVIQLSLLQLGAAYIFIVLLLLIVKIRKIPREKVILIASIRMSLQLVLTGYVLILLFQNSHPLLTLFIVLIMEVFAIYTIIKRSKYPLSKQLKQIILFSMMIGTLTSLLYFLFVVIGLSPWYDPQYFIPIAGMLIGNSMTGISLAVHSLVNGMETHKELIENSLMLGATPKQAAKVIVNHAFDSAILPTLNSMLGMGIVFLPGMMTGQILSGTSPMTAIEYQIAIMLGILGSVSLTVILFVHLGYKTFFNHESQFHFHCD